MKYWVQVQAPAGNWYDSLGSNDLNAVRKHAAHLRERGHTVRIIRRKDTVIK